MISFALMSHEITSHLQSEALRAFIKFLHFYLHSEALYSFITFQVFSRKDYVCSSLIKLRFNEVDKKVMEMLVKVYIPGKMIACQYDFFVLIKSYE
jgi:hypothetical protein